jgi:glycosyltransferase involved in cell wall biosynthesis
MKPLITVLVDTYNHERYIEQAVVSVLEQNVPSTFMEVLVVDDGSTDSTAEIAHRFEPRVRVLRKENGGQASAFNTGLAEAHGEIVAFLDGDDWWMPGKLAAAIEVLEKSPVLAAVGHGFYQVHEDGTPIATVSLKSACHADLSSVDAARAARKVRHFLGGSMICVRSGILKRMGPIPEGLIFSADAFVFSAALALGGALVLEKPLCCYRLHSENLFAFRSQDVSKIRKRKEILEVLVKTVPSLLTRLGVGGRAIRAVVEVDDIAAESQQFLVDRPTRIRFFLHLLKYNRIFRSEINWRLRSINVANAFMALVVGPRHFHLLDQWRVKVTDSLRNLLKKSPHVGKETPSSKS